MFKPRDRCKVRVTYWVRNKSRTSVKARLRNRVRFRAIVRHRNKF